MEGEKKTLREWDRLLGKELMEKTLDIYRKDKELIKAKTFPEKRCKMMTDNYIKMCEKAKEIQKAWKPKDGDRFFWKSYNSPAGEMRVNEFHIVGVGEIEEIKRWWNTVWLPTQEQLQKMILNHGHQGYDNGGILYGIMIFVDENNLGEVSMTELWLHYVMHEKYNKVWNGKEWVEA